MAFVTTNESLGYESKSLVCNSAKTELQTKQLRSYKLRYHGVTN